MARSQAIPIVRADHGHGKDPHLGIAQLFADEREVGDEQRHGEPDPRDGTRHR